MTAERPRPGRLGRVALVAALALAGCGVESRESQNTPDDEVVSFISGLDDTRAMPTFHREFAPGAVPPTATLKRYAGYTYEMTAGTTKFDGETATVPVKIADARTGKEVATKEWALVKEGKGWKIKSAPLP